MRWAVLTTLAILLVGGCVSAEGIGGWWILAGLIALNLIVAWCVTREKNK